MGNHSIVTVFHQGVNDTLPVDHNGNFLRRHLVQVHCLDKFQPLVHQRSRVNGDLRPHGPVWMLQSIFPCHPLQFSPCLSKKRSSGAGEDETPDLPPVPAALEGLKECRVLRIHGQDLRAEVPRLLHYQLSGAYQGLFVGQGDAFALPNGGHGGPQPDHPHHRREHRIGGGQLRRLQQALHAGGHPHRGVRQPDPQVGRRPLIHHNRQLRLELPNLLLHPRRVGVGRQSGRFHAAGGNHVQ